VEAPLKGAPSWSKKIEKHGTAFRISPQVDGLHQTGDGARASGRGYVARSLAPGAAAMIWIG